MNFQKSIEFRYLRETAIVMIVRETGYSIQRTLQLRTNELPKLRTEQVVQHFNDYVSCRSQLFPNLDLLFPTEDGLIFLPGKFKQNLRKLLNSAGQPIEAWHPAKLNQEQIQAILDLKFDHQRPVFQQVLATSLLGFQALRPGEVAGLHKEDIEIDRRLLHLRYTKSQEPQVLPIHEELLTPLANYINHIKIGEPLFIRQTKKPWTRKDVYWAVQQLADSFGINDVNPRKLRSTVAHQMIAVGVPMNVISAMLRHKDEATAARHYTPVFNVEVVRYALNQFRPYEKSHHPYGNED